MAINRNDFIKDLDRLIKVFKMLKEKYPDQNTKEIEYLLQNYENMKSNMPDEIIQQIGEPLRGMITVLIEKLKAEFGDIFEEEPAAEIEEPVIKIENKEAEIALIDDMLKRPGIKAQELDKLLDRRAQLKALMDEEQNKLN